MSRHPLGPKALQLRALRERNAAAAEAESPVRRLAKARKILTEASSSKPSTAPVQASAPSKETTMSKKSKTKKPAAPKAKKRSVSEAAANLKAGKKAAAAAKKAATTPKDGDAAPRAGSKLAIVAELLTRSGGCTTKEVLEATGWPTVSMPQQAKAAGLVLSKTKDGKVSRYTGAPAA